MLEKKANIATFMLLKNAQLVRKNRQQNRCYTPKTNKQQAAGFQEKQKEAYNERGLRSTSAHLAVCWPSAWAGSL